MNQLLTLFIAIPLLSFLVSLFWQNKSEKPIANIVKFTKLVYIALAVLFAAVWACNGLKPLSYHLITIYQSADFVFAVQLYYDEITAVFSIAGALLFFW